MYLRYGTLVPVLIVLLESAAVWTMQIIMGDLSPVMVFGQHGHISAGGASMHPYAWVRADWGCDDKQRFHHSILREQSIYTTSSQYSVVHRR
ncbi:hypothetical protein B0H16DRAFT_820770 [Mycena metata]|uniref:Uncharacterized protein n=1 Tax=Mycena metata TaxID=1033252 RepID=A0AAD7DQS8_9AGAR|nr:hypothetical protein B0H16DRAFT_820770 [Mycena metata]